MLFLLTVHIMSALLDEPHERPARPHRKSALLTSIRVWFFSGCNTPRHA